MFVSFAKAVHVFMVVLMVSNHLTKCSGPHSGSILGLFKRKQLEYVETLRDWSLLIPETGMEGNIISLIKAVGLKLCTKVSA